MGYRLQFCRLTPSTARLLHDKLGASPPNRTASSCSSDRRADHLRQRGDDGWHPARESNSHQEIWRLLCFHYTSGAMTMWWASLESNQGCLPRGAGVADKSTASELLKSNRTAGDTDLPIAEGFLEAKNTKPGFLAEIRASALAAARDGWPTPVVVPPGCCLCPDATNNRALDGQNARGKNTTVNRIRSSPRLAAGPGRLPWPDRTVCRRWPNSVLSRLR